MASSRPVLHNIVATPRRQNSGCVISQKRRSFLVLFLAKCSSDALAIATCIKTLEPNPNNIRSTEDLIEFTKIHPEDKHPERDISKFVWNQAVGIDVDSDRYAEMVEQERYYSGPGGGILGATEKYDVDLFAVPSSWGIVNDLAANMMFPMMSVPRILCATVSRCHPNCPERN
ncbi:glutamyl-tRNA amidotransferase subunit A [Penicillium soppii]|uniref:glutamyl-tRNA amidotransferase subunit A n=1 Tax=Penicillium soppii TaxID=69789 RepID=UPI0025491C0D|nr:glutamyl-tRNA amidotransferase subunit A [Penicillium soppii]KAJ5882412.1 glutamyl-tRNA amidotransferase subunit A [Penicillium soppii]